MKAHTVVDESIYKDVKGDLYKVFAVCSHTETGEHLVVYGCLSRLGYNGKPSPMMAMPKEMFEEYIEIDGQQVPRFNLVAERKSLEYLRRYK